MGNGGMPLWVGVCRVSLFFPEASSLKDKRQVLKGMLDRIRARMNLAAAEVEAQELWQRGEIAFAAVGNDRAVLHSAFMSAVRIIEAENRVEITNVAIDWR